jgi:hypothetical protein
MTPRATSRVKTTVEEKDDSQRIDDKLKMTPRAKATGEEKDDSQSKNDRLREG